MTVASQAFSSKLLEVSLLTKQTYKFLTVFYRKETKLVMELELIPHIGLSLKVIYLKLSLDYFWFLKSQGV